MWDINDMTIKMFRDIDGDREDGERDPKPLSPEPKSC